MLRPSYASLTLMFPWFDLPCSDNNLHFVEAPALAPPEVAYDQNDMVRYEQELTEAAAMPLPDVRGTSFLRKPDSTFCTLVFGHNFRACFLSKILSMLCWIFVCIVPLHLCLLHDQSTCRRTTTCKARTVTEKLKKCSGHNANAG